MPTNMTHADIEDVVATANHRNNVLGPIGSADHWVALYTRSFGPTDSQIELDSLRENLSWDENDRAIA